MKIKRQFIFFNNLFNILSPGTGVYHEYVGWIITNFKYFPYRIKVLNIFKFFLDFYGKIIQI